MSAAGIAGKRNLLGVNVDVTDYDGAVQRIIGAARAGEPLTVSALAVHGVMTGVLDDAHRYRLNHLDLALPDGQPVRWALNLLHHSGLSDRVYGPTLMLKVCEAAAASDIAVFLYGSRPAVLASLANSLRTTFPDLVIAGTKPSRFRALTGEEKLEVADEIRNSGAEIVFVGLGCPRQEVWLHEYRDVLPMPLLAVGAAFDFHAGLLPQAPAKLQRVGLEWLFRLVHEPRRLWRRYLLLNPVYATLVLLQLTRLRNVDPSGAENPDRELGFG